MLGTLHNNILLMKHGALPTSVTANKFLDSFGESCTAVDDGYVLRPVVPGFFFTGEHAPLTGSGGHRSGPAFSTQVPSTKDPYLLSAPVVVGSVTPPQVGRTVSKLFEDTDQLMRFRQRMGILPEYLVHEGSPWHLRSAQRVVDETGKDGGRLLNVNFARADGRFVEVTRPASEDDPSFVLAIGHAHPEISVTALWQMAVQGQGVVPLGVELVLSRMALASIGRFAGLDGEKPSLVALEIARRLYAFQNEKPLQVKFSGTSIRIRAQGDLTASQIKKLGEAASLRVETPEKRPVPGMGPDQMSSLLFVYATDDVAIIKFLTQPAPTVVTDVYINPTVVTNPYIDPSIADLFWIEDLPTHIRTVSKARARSGR
ncbi:MAG: hypothetical protein HQM16_12365 [Deltaproteobacteria bacterium]|nr:hypothetical protein [Deltaproteobacteria bacterium]